jgi:hypothetical protein
VLTAVGRNLTIRRATDRAGTTAVAELRGNGGVGARGLGVHVQYGYQQPLRHELSYANALLGTFREYREIDAFSEVVGKRYISEFYVQDTWKANRA